MKIKFALFFTRISIFLVMFVWTLDKFINPDHAARVYSKFYFLPGLDAQMFTIIGTLQMAVVLGFVAGIYKDKTYGLVFVMHLISTLSSYKQYLQPFSNLLFFAAWPMLAACWFLYLMRDQDTLFSLNKK